MSSLICLIASQQHKIDSLDSYYRCSHATYIDNIDAFGSCWIVSIWIQSSHTGSWCDREHLWINNSEHKKIVYLFVLCCVCFGILNALSFLRYFENAIEMLLKATSFVHLHTFESSLLLLLLLLLQPPPL